MSWDFMSVWDYYQLGYAWRMYSGCTVTDVIWQPFAASMKGGDEPFSKRFWMGAADADGDRAQIYANAPFHPGHIHAQSMGLTDWTTVHKMPTGAVYTFDKLDNHGIWIIDPLRVFNGYSKELIPSGKKLHPNRWGESELLRSNALVWT